jgi:uncharacterized protein YbjT (DUF2867 family)
MASQFLVTGGTGTLGRLVVARLRNAGISPRVLSRGSGGDFHGDLSTGDGVASAVDGVHTVVHCTGSAKGDAGKARALVAAAQRAGVKHLVYIGVVGADRVPIRSRTDRMMFGYFQAKLEAERLITDSGIPSTTLRATQFHDFIVALARPMSKLPVMPAFGGVRFQPVDARDVADRLAELALGEPAGRVPDLGGPKVYPMTELLRGYLDAVGKRRPIVSVRQPGAAARAYRDGANLAPDHADGTRTWEDYLLESVALPANGVRR